MAVMVTADTTWETMCQVCCPRKNLAPNLLYFPFNQPGHQPFWTRKTAPASQSIMVEEKPWLGYDQESVIMIQWRTNRGTSLVQVVRANGENNWIIRYQQIDDDFDSMHCPDLIQKFFLLAIPSTEDFQSERCPTFARFVDQIRKQWARIKHPHASQVANFMARTGINADLERLDARRASTK